MAKTSFCNLEKRSQRNSVCNQEEIENQLHVELYKCETDAVSREYSFRPIDGSRREQHGLLLFDSRKYFNLAINYENELILTAEGRPNTYFHDSLSDLYLQPKNDLNRLDAIKLHSVLRTTILIIYQDIKIATIYIEIDRILMAKNNFGERQ